MLEDGRVVSFGYNYRGQLGHGNTTSEPVPKPLRGLDGMKVTNVSCSYYHSIVSCENGEVIMSSCALDCPCVWTIDSPESTYYVPCTTIQCYTDHGR